jgi:hypothetical protein
MGYLTHGLPEELAEYPIDVFLSYSHCVFPGQSNPELKLWSQKLAKDLREEVIITGLENFSLYLDQSERKDESVDPTEKLAEQLEKDCRNAALLTIMMTPQYLRSEWCKRELEWWEEQNLPDTLAVGGRKFVARVMPTDESKWPEGLKELPAYQFYDVDIPPEESRPFTYRGSTDDLNQYKNALIKISGGIVQRLKDAREVFELRLKELQQKKKLAAPGGQILYLHGRKEAEPVWRDACRKLQERKFVVNPDSPQPLAENGGLDEEYRCQLLSSDGLLILGTDNGPIIDSDMVVIGRQYRQYAVDKRESSLPCAVFDTVGSTLQQERRLLNAKNLGIEWIDGTKSNWSDRVMDWLKEAS